MIGCLRGERVGCNFSRRFDNQAGIMRGGLLFAAGDAHFGKQAGMFWHRELYYYIRPGV